MNLIGIVQVDIKLESFSADGKIKVIKEIRAITGLGLKEAKELVGCRLSCGTVATPVTTAGAGAVQVEKAPVVIKAGVAKADAENLRKLIEAAGGKVSML
jgi:large subunit ribosomal protein L7/L12